MYLTRGKGGEEPISYLGLKCLKNETGTAKLPITEAVIKKCGLKIGANFNCEMEIMYRGTCAPVNYVFFD